MSGETAPEGAEPHEAPVPQQEPAPPEGPVTQEHPLLPGGPLPERGPLPKVGPVRRASRTHLDTIAVALDKAGMGTRITSWPGGDELTAWAPQQGRHTAEVIADEDGYLEIRDWTVVLGEPAQAAATIASVLSTLNASPPPPGQPPSGPGRP